MSLKARLDNYKWNFGLSCHVKKTNDPSILFPTENFTFYFATKDIYANSAADGKVILNFFNVLLGMTLHLATEGKIRLFTEPFIILI